MTTSPPTWSQKFGVGIDHHPEVVARFMGALDEQDLNEARLRMARVPDGAGTDQSGPFSRPAFKLATSS